MSQNPLASIDQHAGAGAAPGWKSSYAPKTASRCPEW